MENRPIAIVYNEPVEREDPCFEASRDILDQVEAVEHSLTRLGVPSVRVAFTRNLRSFIHKIEKGGVRFAFNLCESVDEDPELVPHPAAVMEILGISYTGSSAVTLALTTDKLVTKQLLKAKGIPTPRCETYDGSLPPRLKPFSFPIIVKPRFQDASIGIDQDSVFASDEELRQRLPEFHDRFGSLILEEYVSGREFNVSLFGYPTPRLLPTAEISFDELPRGIYPIVGYKAKWDKKSFEYHHTPRVFPRDLPYALERKIHQTALRCFQYFMLRDYGRVDMRVDHSGGVYVLEINANPCISPDAGFPAALAEAGISYKEFVYRLLQFVQSREQKVEHAAYHRQKTTGYRAKQ